MAENYSLQLQLDGYDKFVTQAETIDDKIDKVGKSLESLAGKFNKLDFGVIKFDTKALEGLLNLDVKGKSTSIAALVKAYTGLGEQIKAIDAAKLTEINKALSGGAKADTITAKATAFGLLADEIGRVSRLKNLAGVPEALKQIFEALSASTTFDADKIKLIGPAITKLVKSLDSLNELKFSQDTIKYLERLTESLTLLGAGNNIAMLKELIPVIKAISASFKSFGVDTKTFDSKVLSANLNAAGTALQKFLAVSKEFGGGLFNKTFENFKAMATAVKELGKAFVEFKTPTSSFGDIEKNISATIRALNSLKGEFANFGGTTSKSVKIAAESFKAIGDAASSLGARSKSFDKLPENIQKLNQALLNLDLNRIRQLEPALRAIGPTLQSLSNLASVTGKSFSQMGKTATTSVSDTSAFTRFKAVIASIPGVVNGTISALQKLVPAIVSVSSALLKMPVDFVRATFKVLTTAILAPIKILEFLGNTARKVESELRLLQLGLTILLTPFKALQNLVGLLGNAFNGLVSIIQKAFGVFDKFGFAFGKTKNDFAGFGTAIDKSTNDFSEYGVAVEKTRTSFTNFGSVFDKFKSNFTSFGSSIDKSRNSFSGFSNDTDNAKNKSTQLSSTLETLNSRTQPIATSFRQMGTDIRSSIDDSTTGRFIQFSTSLQAITTIGSAVVATIRQISQTLNTLFDSGYNAAASLENVRKSLNVLNAGDLMRQQTDGTLQLNDAISQTVTMTDELLARYQRFALESIFSREQLTSAHQLAQTLGFTAEEAEELVHAAADWATANGLAGESIKALILPLGQIRSLQKANTVDLKQTITAGNVPAFELLRQEIERVTGRIVTMTEVQGLLSEGMVTSDVAIGAILKGFKAFEGLATTSTGTLSGLQNAFGDLKEGLITNFLTPILSSEEGLRDLFTTMLSADNIIGAFNKAAGFGKQFAAVVVPAVKSVAQAFFVLQAAWAAIPDPIRESIKFAIKFVAITATLTAAIFAVTATISTLVSGFSLFVGAVPLATAAVAAFVTTLITNFGTMRKAIADILWSFSELPEIIRSVGKALQQIFNSGSYNIGTFANLSSLSRQIAVGLTAGITAIATALSDVWNVIVVWLGQLGDLSVTLYGYGVDTILAFADGIWNGAGALVNAFSSISDLFTSWFQPHSPPKVAAGLDEWGKETAGIYVDSLAQGVEEEQGTFLDSVKAMFSQLKNIVLAGLGVISATIVNTMVTFSDVLRRVIDIMSLPVALIIGQIATIVIAYTDIAETIANPFFEVPIKIGIVTARIFQLFNEMFGLVIDLALATVGQLFNIFFDFSKFIGREFQFIGQMLTFAFPSLTVGDSVNKVGDDILNDLDEATVKIDKSLEKLAKNIKNKFSDYLAKAILETTAQIGGNLRKPISFSEILLKGLENIAKGLLNIFSAIGLFSFNVVTTGLISILNILKSIYGIFVGIGTAVVKEIILVVDTITNIFTTVFDPILSFKDKFIRVLNEIGYFITGTFSNIGGIFTSIFDGIRGVLQSFIDFLGGVYLSALISLAQAFPNTFGSIYEDIVTFSQEAGAAINDFVNDSTGSFVDLLVNMVDFGYGLIQSFSDGIYDAIGVVSDALGALGDMITFWLAPGSPPNLLPDIDEWGTAAAQEFLNGFNEADIDVINDFGKTIGDTLDKLNVEGVNVEEVTRAFATGLSNLKENGQFGADVMQQIVDLTADAGPEVQSLASKYKVLAEEQVKLNKTTETYNEELRKAQGTLDTLNANEEIDNNKKRLENLNNALTNTYLSTEERTKIQTQIDKLQATNKVKQLEQQVKAQESNVESVTKSIDLQKQLLDVADAFDGTKSANAAKKASDAAAKAEEAAAKKAEAAAKRMTALQLQQELAGKTTEEQIAIYQEYLSTLVEGTEEYVKTQTKIIELEARLTKEREAANKKLGKAGQLAADFGEGIASANSPFGKAAEQIKQKTEQVSTAFETMVARVKSIWNTFQTFFTVGETVGFVGGFDFSSFNKAAITIGLIFGSISKQIKYAAGLFDTYVLKNDLVKNSLIALATALVAGGIVAKIKNIALTLSFFVTPINLVVAALALLSAGIYTFIQSSGGLEATLTRLQALWTRFTSAFRAGEFATDFKVDFSSFESAATSLGLLLGTTFFDLGANIRKAFSDLVTEWNNSITTFSQGIDFSGLSRVKDFFSKNWIEIITGIGATLLGIFSGSWFLVLKGIALILKNFTLPTDLFAQFLLDIVWNFNTYLITPLIAAFTQNDTILGKIAAAAKVFYSGIGTILGNGISTVFSNLGSGGFAKQLDEFFATSFIGKAIEDNVNEAVGVIIPSLAGNFDLSTFANTVLTQFNSIVNAIKGFVTNIANIFTQGPLANAITSLKDAFKDFFTSIASSQFLSAIASISKGIGYLVAGILGLVSGLTTAGLIGILKNLPDLFIVVGQAIQKVIDGVQLIISGNIFGGILTILDGIFGGIGDIFDVVGQAIADTVLAMVSFFSPAWAKKLEPLVSIISKLIVSFFGWNGIMSKAFAFLGRIFAPLGRLFTATETAVNGTKTTLTGFQRIMEPFSIVIKNVGNAFKEGWKAILQFSENIPGLKALLQSLGTLFEVLTRPIRFVIDLLKQLWVYLFPPKASSGASVFAKIFDTIVAAFNKLLTYIPTVVSTLQKVWQVIMNIATAIIYVVSKIAEFITLMGKLVFELVKNIVTSNIFVGVLRWIFDLVKALWSVFSLVIKVIFKFGQYIFNIGQQFFTALKPVETFINLFKTLQVIASIIGTSLAKVGAIAISLGITIYNAINNGIQKILQVSYVSQFVKWATGWVTAIWTGLKTFVTSLPTKIMEWTKALSEWLEPHSPPKFLPDLMEWGSKIGLLFLQAIVGVPLKLIATWGKNIGNAIVNFDWMQFGKKLKTKFSNLVSSAITNISKVGVAIGTLFSVTDDKEQVLAKQIQDLLPDLSAVFGEGANEKISLGISDFVTFNQEELTTATKYFNEFKDVIFNLLNIGAIPEAFTNSLATVIGFFNGDIGFVDTIITVFKELDKVVNLTAVPELFISGVNALLSLFLENTTVGTIIKDVVGYLGDFATLVGIPQPVVDSVIGLYDYLTGEDLSIEQALKVQTLLFELEKLKGISQYVYTQVENLFNLFFTNKEVDKEIDEVAASMTKLSNTKGVPQETTDNTKALLELFTGYSTVPQIVKAMSDSLETFYDRLLLTDFTDFNTKYQPVIGVFYTTEEQTKEADESIRKFYERIKNLSFSDVEEIFKPITDLFYLMESLANNINQGIKDFADTIKNLSFSDVEAIFKPITDIFFLLESQSSKLATFFNFSPEVDVSDTEVTGTDEVVSNIEDSISTAVNDNTIDLNTRIKTITDKSNLSEESAKVLTAFNDSLVENATFMDDNLTGAIKTYISNGFNAEQIKTLAKEAGVEVPAGLEEAFANPENWSGVNTEAGTQLTNLFNSIKANLGIESPSTVARDEIGVPIVEGIAEGLGKTEGIDFATPVNNIFTSIITAAQVQLSTISEKINIVAALFTFDEIIVEKTRESLTITVELFTTSFETITTTITESLELYLELFEEFFATFAELLEEFITSFLDKLDELVEQVSEKIRALIAAIRAFAPSFNEAGKSLANAFVKGFKDYLSEDGAGRSQIESTVNSLANFVSSSNTTLYDAFLNSGKSFGQPFVEGIAAGIDESRDSARLKAAVAALVNRIITEARTVAGIASPSKVAATLVGLPIAEGVMMGIESGINLVSSGMTNLIDSIFTINNQVGENFNAGIADGIVTSTNLVTDAVRRLADESIVAAQTALDINSPSKVTNKLIGLPFVQGIAQALESGKGLLSPLTADLLSVLPKNANFDLGINQDLRLKEQGIDVKYNGLLNSLPTLSQNIHINRMVNAQKARLENYTNMLMIPHQMQKQQALANTSYMNDSRSTVVNNHNEYHMHLTTSETNATRRVEKNFNAMRFGYRFR